MAWRDPKTLKFDIDEITQMRDKIEETATELLTVKEQLMTALDNLKNDWKTPAGRTFTEEVDTNWGENIDQYVKTMKAVAAMLDVAKLHYVHVEDAVEKITF